MTQLWSKSKNLCTHYDAKMVLKLKAKGRLWAGSAVELQESGPWDLIISAVGYIKFLENPVSANSEAKALLPVSLLDYNPPACVGLDWPDRDVPRLTEKWWQDLAEMLRGFEGRVGICCMGGHGRTGTALAILASMLGKVKKGDCPVTWVRKKYCKVTVESQAQLDYVEKITRREVTAELDAVASYTYAASQPLPSHAAGVAGAVIPFKTYGEATAEKVNPTGTTQTSTPHGSVIGEAESSNVIIKGFEPTDAELERAFEDGDGEVTLLIHGAGNRRWFPVWGKDDDEIVGWMEEEPKELTAEKDKVGYY